MPRQARLDVPGALHHIMVRGINKSAIFQDDQDRMRFLERLGQTIVEGKCAGNAFGVRLAYCERDGCVTSNLIPLLFQSFSLLQYSFWRAR